jgi:TRAP transporter TAXI family solute receptor
MPFKRKQTDLRHTLGASALAAAVAAGSLLAGSAAAEVASVVTFAVPPEGTSGYILVTGYSKVITEKTAVKKVQLQTFGGAAGWPARMQTGEVDFGSHCGFKLVDEAYNGHGPFEKLGRQKNVRSMLTGHGLPFAVNVIDDNIKKYEDLKGKTLFVLMTHADQRTAMQVAAKSVGMELGKDIKVIPVRSPAEAMQGLKTGRGDGLFYGLIVPFAEIQRTKGFHSLPMTQQMMDAIIKAEPAWGTTVVRAGQPPLRPKEPVPTLEIQCGLAAGAKTSADTVYEVTKAIYENLPAWNSVHPLAKQWNLKRALKVSVAPYHDGAIRYYKEKGIWTPDMDKLQQALLAK